MAMEIEVGRHRKVKKTTYMKRAWNLDKHDMLVCLIWLCVEWVLSIIERTWTTAHDVHGLVMLSALMHEDNCIDGYGWLCVFACDRANELKVMRSTGWIMIILRSSSIREACMTCTR